MTCPYWSYTERACTNPDCDALPEFCCRKRPNVIRSALIYGVASWIALLALAALIVWLT